MKIILAGFPKTGTKTLSHALRNIGYSVYDYEEHFWYHSKQWIKIFRKGSSIEEFREMYKDIDVVSDVPASFFWEDISKAFPEAKIILMMRDDEEIWWQSLWQQIKMLKGFVYTWATLISPTALYHLYYSNLSGAVIFGAPGMFPWSRIVEKPLLFKLCYRRHNCSVTQNARKDRLLVYNVKEGWGPLCHFLDIKVPEEPFPHDNKNGEIAKKLAMYSPPFQRIKKEVMFSTMLIVALTGFGICKRFY